MPKALLCPPDHYAIDYEINPWMNRRHAVDAPLARAQWQRLHDALLKLGCEIELIPPQPGLPDMVFTANAGLVAGSRVLLSNFRFKERRGETVHFERWFREHGYDILRMPESACFEGEGDALMAGDILVCGYRFRSDVRAHQRISETLHCLAISVELVDARFYHLDTCFCPLPGGGAIWFPPAFDEYGRRALAEHVTPLIEVSEEEAVQFACNAVVLRSEILLPENCPALCRDLSRLGYVCHALPMTEFIKAGGACKCLTLFLSKE